MSQQTIWMIIDNHSDLIRNVEFQELKLLGKRQKERKKKTKLQVGIIFFGYIKTFRVFFTEKKFDFHTKEDQFFPFYSCGSLFRLNLDMETVYITRSSNKMNKS